MQVDDLCTLLGRRLRTARKACHMTQDKLAEKSNVSSRHISKIENGEMNPSYEILHALISAMNISADILFYPAQSTDDQLFQRLAICCRICSEEQREKLLRTVEFITTNLLSD